MVHKPGYLGLQMNCNSPVSTALLGNVWSVSTWMGDHLGIPGAVDIHISSETLLYCAGHVGGSF